MVLGQGEPLTGIRRVEGEGEGGGSYFFWVGGVVFLGGHVTS